MNGLDNLANSLLNLSTQLNSEVSIMRGATHKKFDRIWKQGYMTRTSAYVWLAEQMQIDRKHAHISLLDVEQCKEIQRLVIENFPNI